MAMTTIGLDQAIERTKRQKLEEALQAGATSVRAVARHLQIAPGRAWRLLREFHYAQESTWKPKKRSRTR